MMKFVTGTQGVQKRPYGMMHYLARSFNKGLLPLIALPEDSRHSTCLLLRILWLSGAGPMLKEPMGGDRDILL